MFYAYIMTNKPRGTLYIGHTDDLPGRVWEHQNRVSEGFTKRYNLDKLVWYEGFDTRESAFLFERRMKTWKRRWKIEEIEKLNPHWEDLAYKI